MKRIGHLFQCLAVGLMCACSSAQAQQYKWIKDIPVVRPSGLVATNDNRIYVTSAQSKTVTIIDSSGNVVSYMSAPESLSGAVVKAPNGNLVFQTDDGKHIITDTSLQLTGRIPVVVHGLSLLANGQFYSAYQDRVMLHDAFGSILKSVTVPRIDGIQTPPDARKTFVAPNGYVYVSVSYPSQVLIYDQNLNLLGESVRSLLLFPMPVLTSVSSTMRMASSWVLMLFFIFLMVGTIECRL